MNKDDVLESEKTLFSWLSLYPSRYLPNRHYHYNMQIGVGTDLTRASRAPYDTPFVTGGHMHQVNSSGKWDKGVEND